MERKVPLAPEDSIEDASFTDADNVSQRSHVASEFGGPEDFTENMTEYMKGIRGPKVNDTIDESGIDEESIFEPACTSTPPSRTNASVRLPLGEESPQLPSPVLQNPKTRPQSQPQQAEETFLRVSALQAEVEKLRKAEEERLQKQQQLERENEELKKENEEAFQRFEELERLSQPDRDDEQEFQKPESLSSTASELEKAQKQIEKLKEKLNAAQDRAEELESEMDSLKENRSNAVVQLQEELQEQKEATDMDRNKSFVIAREAAKLNDTKEQQGATIQTLRDELQETQRILRDVEEENERLVEEGERMVSEEREVSPMLEQIFPPIYIISRTKHYLQQSAPS